MKTSTKVVIVTLILTIAGFLTEPNGPLGAFWAPARDVPQALGAQVPLFMLLGTLEALAFGLGVSFLLFGYASLKAIPSVSAPMARAAHLSISWLLLNWWAHDSLHLHNGMNLNGLLGIEYGFHVTLIAAGVVLARFFVAIVRAPAMLSGAVGPKSIGELQTVQM
jgi:hypothetical protein